MKKLLALLTLILVSVNAEAGFNSKAEQIFYSSGTPPTLALNLNFAQSSLPAGLTYSRTGTATDIIGGTLTSFSANVPRISATNGLLIEESRTNIAFNNSGSFASGGSETAGQTDPLGTSVAFLFTENTSNSSHGRFINNATPAGSTTYTVSMFLKAGTADRVQIAPATQHAASNVYANFYLNGSGSVSATGAGASGSFIQSLNSGWYRAGFTFTTSASPTASSLLGIYSLVTGSETRAPSFVGTSRTFYSAMAQYEVGKTVSSYIPAPFANATRGADSLVTTSTSFINSTEGTLYVSATTSAFLDAAGSDQTLVGLNDGTTSNFDGLRRLASDTTVRGMTITGGASQSSISGGTVADATAVKVAYAYKANDMALSINGGAAVTDTSGTMPTVTTLRFGAATSSTGFLNGYLKAVKYWTIRISDADLALATQ